jgi:hypothetical protein
MPPTRLSRRFPTTQANSTDTAGIGDSCILNISRIEDPHARYLSVRITIDFPNLPTNQRHNVRYETLEISSSISFSQLFS